MFVGFQLVRPSFIQKSWDQPRFTSLFLSSFELFITSFVTAIDWKFSLKKDNKKGMKMFMELMKGTKTLPDKKIDFLKVSHFCFVFTFCHWQIQASLAYKSLQLWKNKERTFSSALSYVSSKVVRNPFANGC